MASSGLQAQVAPAEIVIPASGRYPTTINGTSLVAEASPDSSSYPTLSAALAQRLALKTDLLGSLVNIQVRIGPQVVRLHTGYARLSGTGKRRVIWSEGPGTRGAELVLGPDALPAQRVTFVLDPAGSATRVLSFPLARSNSLSGTVVRFHGQPVFVTFAPQRTETLVTAPTGQILAEGYGGQLLGDVRKAELYYSAIRPIRRLALDRTPEFGGLALRTIWMRIADYGNTAGIADNSADPDEIVVAGRKQSSKALFRIAVGRADLAGCASITFDKPARQIVLRC